MSKNKNFLFKIVLTSLLVALNIIMERFLAYSVWNLTISFSFITIAFAAVFLGIPYTIIVAGLGDFIGAILFPFGTYFPGFTFTNCLAGFILAFFIHKKCNILTVSVGVIINKIVCTVILNSIWISILYRGGISAFFVVMVPRLIPAAVGAVIEIVVITLLFSNRSKIKNSIQKMVNRYC